MQDKIQDIMVLISTHAQMHRASFMGSAKENSAYRSEADKTRSKIESKLRELVREPLTPTQRMEILHSIPDDDDADSEWMLTDMQLQLIMDAVERAHGITNTSGEV